MPGLSGLSAGGLFSIELDGYNKGGLGGKTVCLVSLVCLVCLVQGAGGAGRAGLAGRVKKVSLVCLVYLVRRSGKGATGEKLPG